MSKFQKAKRTLAKLRVALTGPSGSGKTFSALLIAKGLGGKIAVIDTERGSASLYADLPGMPEYSTLQLSEPYSPETYIQAIKDAEAEGFDVCIIDSMTHEWSGTGGCLEINDSIARSKYRGNTWSAWSEVTPRHRKFIEAIIQSPMHMICTMRSKTETAQEKDSGGRTKVVKVGMKSEQRDGMDYEFTVVLDLTVDGHFANASKDRTSMFNQPFVITEETGEKFKKWIETASPEATKKPDLDPAFLADAREAAESGEEIFVAWGRKMAISNPEQMKIFKSLPISKELYNTARTINSKE